MIEISELKKKKETAKIKNSENSISPISGFSLIINSILGTGPLTFLTQTIFNSFLGYLKHLTMAA